MTSRSRSFFVAFNAVVAIGGFTACGGGTQVTTSPLPERIEVRVSAGAPIAGAVVTVYAISDVTGLKDETVGGGGVLGSAGPTDSTGAATITLASRSYSGPVQIVASGPALFYADPTVAAESGSSAVVIQIPATFSLSSYVTRFSKGAPVVPVTLLTTLADRAALAWARGRHPAQRTPSTITAALGARDPLFVAHVTKDAAAWSPSALRTTVPAPLAAGPQTLVDSAYAALLDIALNQLARDVAARAGYGASSNAITAVTIAQLLQDDLDADGRFDGRGVGGLLLATPGNPPVALDEQFLRVPIALALDAWIRNTGANRSGIGQADLVSAKVYDALTTDASDLFGGPPAAGVFDPVDRTPPVLTFAAAPTQYTNQTTLTLTVNATDATGVKGVFAQSGTKKFTATAGDGGTWILAVDLVPGHNPLTIWGEDTAQAANSALGSTEPYQYTLDILLDTSPPTAMYDASFASYAPERGVTIAANADGTAALPARPLVGAKQAIPANGEILKMASTLSAGGPVDVAELEGTNARNIPVLRFAVPHDSAIQSPIVDASFSVQVGCSGCAFPARTGALLASPTATAGFLYFDLPISTESIPDLAAVTGPASVAVTLSLRDAAGNITSGIDGGTLTFHALGPAVAIVEDPNYALAGDPSSTFMYAAGAAAYAALFDASAQQFLPDKQVRLARYVVTNPWPVPVAIDTSLTNATWTMTETWKGEMRQMPGIAYTADGFTFGGTTDWAATCTGFTTFPCGSTAADQDSKYPVHFPGSTTQYNCDTKPGIAGSTSPWSAAPFDLNGAAQGSAPLEVHAFIPGGPWDSTPASTAGSIAVVPAATAMAPGRLHVYVTRPAAVTAGRTIPLAFGALNPSSPVARFETWQWDHWMDTDPAHLSCTYQTITIIQSCAYCGYYSLGCMVCGVPITVTSSYRHWWAYRHVRYLASAADNLAGSLSVSSLGLVGDASGTFGEASVQANSIDVQRSIAH
ncbi:hypothetical protein Adeh_3238 [Anaeromyxobacter dehalogenans 2CP-C]|uniref:Uncharacterized protein n=1 Tax=Anaeromyxobacter dehalogenans (strain 2CP-C) TaxID=290397 RepID=Q2IEK1_ANADE|nr:hypothetical protein Adeh_3238 [Anaeromyxobacter dehalogenans 2CP-C]